MRSGSTIAIAQVAESLFFNGVPDDILVNILCRLDEDPGDLARLACVSMRFCKLIKTVCWKLRCEKNLPLLVAELLQAPSPALHPCPEPPGGWASLQKLLVCCPGLWHAGVLLENWDFGLDREIGWFDDFGYPDGVSYSTVADSIFSESGYFPNCKSLGMNSNGNEGGVNCENEDMGTHEKEVGMYKYECDKKGYTTHMDGNENGMNIDGIKQVINSEFDEEGIKFVKTDMGMESCQCNKTGNKLGPKHCRQPERSVTEGMNSVAEEQHARDHEFQESAIRPQDDSLGSEVLEGDGVMVATKGETPQIYKPTLLNSDPLNIMSLETGCRHQSKEGSDLVDILVNQMHTASPCSTSHKKRMQEHKPKSHKRQRKCHSEHCHVTTRPWSLSREQGNKLLANRFRSDSLYICDWPGCLHPGDKRMYKLFRGVFKNFKHSHVWRNLKDMQAKATNVGCAFCVCKSTWDMVTTFCLKRSIEYHDDGEPVVRAYVCENGHVAGAWTDRPMYTL